jgi:hypothetical protein
LAEPSTRAEDFHVQVRSICGLTPEPQKDAREWSQLLTSVCRQQHPFEFSCFSVWFVFTTVFKVAEHCVTGLRIDWVQQDRFVG